MNQNNNEQDRNQDGNQQKQMEQYYEPVREMRNNEVEFSRDLKREFQGGRRRKTHKYKNKP